MTSLTTTYERPRIDEPLVVLTYAYSGVARLRALLEQFPGLAWVGTDLVKSCDQLAVDPAVLLDVVRAAGAPVICETPAAGLAADIRWLREHVAG